MPNLDILVFGAPSGISLDLTSDVITGDDAVLRLTLAPEDVNVKLSDGTSLDSVMWRLALYDQTSSNAPARTEASLGAVRISDRQVCFVQATMKSTQFAKLLSGMQVGSVPDHFELTVLGASPGPEGSVWQTETVPELEVSGLTISTSLARPQRSAD